jgi:hypothetical protein
MTERELKQEAADFLDAVALSVASGWGKGSWVDEEGDPCCLEGHSFEILERCRVLVGAVDYADQTIRDRIGPIAWWNDAPERTQDDVIALCHQVAHQLRQEAR